jgi:hypothetical protein
MKRTIALVALLALGGMVGLGALLISGDFPNAPSASATTITKPLFEGKKHTPVGTVYVRGWEDGLHITYLADPGHMMDEVHVCIWPDGTEPPEWTAPGQCPYKSDPSDPQWRIDVHIEWEDVPGWCGDHVWIQAHAAMEGGETAYGEKFKGSFDVDIPCCF